MKATTKNVQIIARYAFKADPRKVCYLIRSARSNACYFACLFDGKGTSCECPATKPCYHLKQLEAREAERVEPVKVVSAREMALAAARAASDQELARIEQEVQAQVAAELAAPRKPLSEMAMIAEITDGSVSSSEDEESDPWEGLDEEEKYVAWRNYEMSIAG